MKPDEVEYMNAYGPYDHGIWDAVGSDGASVTFGNNSLFATRAEVMADKIIKYLQQKFTSEELHNASIVDIGCYDGWVLSKISKSIKFKRAVGIEPRQKNIDKGKFARKICGVDTACQFYCGGYQDLEKVFPSEMFDIVLCLGMAHHVNSIEHLIKTISYKSSNLLIVDSMIIPPLDEDYQRIAAVINPVDIIYRKKEKIWGLAAYKMESPYFDGSAEDVSLVNIPQESLIRMCLQSSNFSSIDTLMSEKDFYPKDFQKIRGVNEIMLGAFRDSADKISSDNWFENAKAYEELFCLYTSSDDFMAHLNANFNSDELSQYFIKLNDFSQINKRGIDHSYAMTEEEREILENIPRAPFEKVLIELAKYCMHKDNNELARIFLEAITKKKNSDWRSFYRACFLLSVIEKEVGNEDRLNHYQGLLLISNPLFPKKIGGRL
jgi:hypothetical protein